MKRKRFVKLMMAAGVGRNAANWMLENRNIAKERWFAAVRGMRGMKCITNMVKTKVGWTFRVKCAD